MSKKSSVAPRYGRNARRQPRNRRKRILVVCGGAVTEPEYFKHVFKDRVALDVDPKNLAPHQLAQHAVKLKDEDEKNSRAGGYDSYAEVWVVVDVDNYHDHAEAQRICDRQGMKLIISNPCFEVWLIDHVQQCPDSCAMAKDAETYAAKLGVTKGNRNKYIDFTKIDGHMADAIANAKRHNTAVREKARCQLIPRQEQPYAPWTDMAVAVEPMRK